jgi:hypothetical protein
MRENLGSQHGNGLLSGNAFCNVGVQRNKLVEHGCIRLLVSLTTSMRFGSLGSMYRISLKIAAKRQKKFRYLLIISRGHIRTFYSMQNRSAKIIHDAVSIIKIKITDPAEFVDILYSIEKPKRDNFLDYLSKDLFPSFNILLLQ